MALSSRRFYFAFKKQTVFGTAVVPDIFPRWLDGSELKPEMKVETIMEGDGGMDASLTFKTGQLWKGKLVAYLRPVEIGHFLQGILGSGSDAANTPGGAVSTTLSAAAAAGATTISTVASVAVGTVLQIGTGATAETRTTTAVAGAGPYTVTVPALTYAHASGESAVSVTTHTLTAKDVPSYFTAEWAHTDAALLAAGNSPIYRVKDCVFTKIEIEGEANKPVKVTLEFVGRSATRQSALLTVALEAGDTFRFVNGLYLLDTVSIAAKIGSFKVSMDMAVDTDIYTASVTPDDILWTGRKIDAELELIFDSDIYFRRAFFGGSTGTTDVAALMSGALDLKMFQSGDANEGDTFQVQLPSLVYAGDPLDGKLDGKALRQKLSFTAVKPTSGSIVTAILNNTKSTAY